LILVNLRIIHLIYDDKKINLVLSGGGAGGAIHVGVYQYLKEHNYEIQEIAGTSVGSLIGCLIAAEVHPQELIKVMRDSQIKDFLNPFLKHSYSTLDLKDSQELFDIGYGEAQKILG